MNKIIYNYDYVYKNNNNNQYNIIFCHGFNSSPRVFDIFKNYWDKSDYYALQFPGNNNTKPIGNDQVSVFDFARLLVEFIENNNLQNVILIGHSMGGGIISLAYQLKPQLFKKLIYIAPMNKASEDIDRQFLVDYFPKTFDDLINNLLTSLYYDSSKYTNNPSWMRLAKKTFSANDYNNQLIVKLGKTLVSSQVHDSIDQALSSIKVPCLLILGETDGVVDRDKCLEYFQTKVENIKTYYIPKTGHMVFEENWEQFIKIVEEFIDK
ncbi:alpha/beta hydrolase [Mycoplasma putrefaciens]|uniref:alpha/beta hydrolase n=1 Tax=Mycoplasma putrefaciens TaxID=2123 RepID=UPI003DA670DD